MWLKDLEVGDSPVIAQLPGRPVLLYPCRKLAAEVLDDRTAAVVKRVSKLGCAGGESVRRCGRPSALWVKIELSGGKRRLRLPLPRVHSSMSATLEARVASSSAARSSDDCHTWSETDMSD
jgi:hypothetical protein